MSELTRGNIILLNGTSSSGKSSVARALQQALDGIYFHVEVDRWRDMHPEPDFRRRSGMMPLLHAIPHSLAVLARGGNNLIIDDIFGVGQARNYASAFQNLSITYVGVRCDLAVMEQREALRGDRLVGTARELYDFVYADAHFDIEVDTTAQTALECAQRIQTYQENSATGTALKQLLTKL